LYTFFSYFVNEAIGIVELGMAVDGAGGGGTSFYTITAGLFKI